MIPRSPRSFPLLRLASGLLGLFALAAAAGPAQAELRIELTRGVVEPMPIAVSNFFAEGSAESQTGRDLARVISANLERSGLFRPLDQRAFIQDPAALRNQPRFADWRVLNAQALVSGAVSVETDGRLRVEFRLWDVFAESQTDGLAYFTARENWRRIAHIISDRIYKRITGEDGYFDTRIVYIAEMPGSGGRTNPRGKRLAIMDQDGENNKFLSDASVLVLTPRFSPTANDITYLAYFNNRPRVYLFNIDSGRQEVLGDFPGMTFAPRFSPDGNKVIMSLALDGNSNIYTLDLRTRHQTRLTDSTAIDTSPCYSPDGARIVFESDRGGSQQLYMMNADGSGVQRISFGQGHYASPVWSPRGDWIAFTRIAGGRFGIGVIRPDGSGERLLSEAFHIEGPTWAPNGRVLMYFKETPTTDGKGRRAQLFTIDLNGRNERRVNTPAGASDPAWSPLIP
ncbi:MAG: Tol-Pal system protein TolB [Azospirillum sp.]|nr:Tol-Pal system protein TolB [Azospirillum sp.]